MARRVNTPFVIGLVAALVLVAGVVTAALLYLQTRGGRESRGDEFYARAVSLMEQADAAIVEGGLEAQPQAFELRREARDAFSDAVHEYQGAASQDPRNTELRRKQFDALRQMVVENRDQFQDRIGRMQAAVSTAYRRVPGDDTFREWMDLLIKLGDWVNVRNESHSAIEGQPALIMPRLYRSAAVIELWERRPARDTDEWAQAGDDLEHVREELPDDAMALHYHGRWHAGEAERLEANRADAETVAEHREQAVELIERSWEGLSDDRRLRLAGARVLAGLDQTETAREMFEAVEAAIRDEPRSSRDFYTYVTELGQMPPGSIEPDGTEGDPGQVQRHRQQRMREVVERALEAMPESVPLRYQQAMIHRQTGGSGEAVRLLRSIYEDPFVLPPLEGMLALNVQQRAGSDLVEALLEEAASSATDSERRSELVKEAEALIESVRSEHGDSDPLRLSEAWLAVLKEDYRRALRDLQALRSNFRRAGDGRRYLMVLQLTAEAAMQTGESGVAMRALEELNRAGAGNINTTAMLAALYMESRRFDDAEQLLEPLAEYQDQMPQIRGLRAQLYHEQDRPERVIELLEPVADELEARQHRLLVETLIEAGRGDDAADLLEARLEAEPADMAALQHYVARFSDRREQVQQLLDRAREAGAPERGIEMLARMEDGRIALSPDDVEEIRQAQLEHDPVGYYLQQWRGMLQRGQHDRAKETLESAIEADAVASGNGEHSTRVIEARMRHAIETGDLETAEQLVEVAAERDTDGAGGLLYEAQLRILRGDADEAVRLAEAAVERLGVSSSANQLLGDAHRATGDLERAVRAYRTAVEQRPGNIEARLALTQVLERRGEGGQALLAARRAMEHAPQNPQVQSRYIALEERFGDPADAIDHLRDRVEQAPDDLAGQGALIQLLARHNRVDEARERAETLREQQPGNVNILAQLAAIHAMAGDVSEGRRLIESHIRELGDDAGLREWLVLAGFLQQSGDLDGALDALVEARRHDDEARTAHRRLATLLYQVGDYERAERMYRDLHERFPQDLDLALEMVQNLSAQQRFEEAEDKLSQVTESLPEARRVAAATLLDLNRTQILVQRAEYLGQRADQHAQAGEADRARQVRTEAAETRGRALEMLEQTLTRGGMAAPQHARLRTIRANLLRLEGRIDDALGDLRRAIEIDPTLDRARLLRAQVLSERGTIAPAVEGVRALLERNPEHEEGRRLLAQLYERRPDRYDDDLARLLMESARLFPADPFWLARQGQQAVRQQRYDRAVRFFRQRLELESTPQAVADLATSLIELGQYEQAREVVNNYPSRLRQSPLLLAIQGRALMGLDRREQAARSFELAVGRVNGPAAAASVMVQLREAVGLDNAVELLDAVASLEAGSNTALLMQWQVATTLMGEQQHDRAAERFEALDEALPSGHRLYLRVQQGLALALDGAGRAEASLDAYDRILAVDPENLNALNNSAFLMTRKPQMYEKGLERARKAAELVSADSPAYAQVLDTVGYLEFLLGQQRDDRELIEASRRTLRRSTEVQETPHNLYHLGLVEMHMERLSVARTLLQRAVQMAESNRRQYEDVLEGARDALGQLAGG